jgi:hypothetical protein
MPLRGTRRSGENPPVPPLSTRVNLLLASVLWNNKEKKDLLKEVIEGIGDWLSTIGAH